MLFLKHKSKSEEGFTLIELLVVIVIIGVLAAIALPIFLNQQKAAMKAGIKADARNLTTAVATYLTKKPTATNLEFRAENGSTSGPLKDDPLWNGDSIKPSDPSTILVVRKTQELGSGPGSFQGYVVIAANTNVEPGVYYYFVYSSYTGKFEETSAPL